MGGGIRATEESIFWKLQILSAQAITETRHSYRHPQSLKHGILSVFTIFVCLFAFSMLFVIPFWQNE